MGIRQLKRYIDSDRTRYKEVCVKVNLRDLAEEWRNTGGKSIIVADGPNVTKNFERKFEFVSGGEYKAIVKCMENFIEAFDGIGVDLVFFFGGSAPSTEALTATIDTEPNEVKRKVEEIFRKVDTVMLRDHSTNFSPFLGGKVVKNAARDLATYVRVTKDRDRYMVEYAIKNKCLGIMSDDTDLFVFDGVPHLLSRNSLCMKTMTTIEYRRDVLLRYLCLPSEAMPIFSTLMGNDVVLYEHSMMYQDRVLPVKRGDQGNPMYPAIKVSVLGERTKHIFYSSGGDVNKAITLLAEEIFGHVASQWNPIPAGMVNCLRRSLLTYKTFPDEPAPMRLSNRPSWNELRDYAIENTAHFRFGRKTISIMFDATFTQKAILESPRIAKSALLKLQRRRKGRRGARARKFRCMCNSEVLIELRRRIYSVIVFEKTIPYGAKEFVEEFFLTGCRDPFEKGTLENVYRKIYLVSTIPIDVEHPGLYRLWFGNSDLNNIRWKLFLWMISSPICDASRRIYKMEIFWEPFFEDQFGFVGFVLFYLYQLFLLTRNTTESLKSDHDEIWLIHLDDMVEHAYKILSANATLNAL